MLLLLRDFVQGAGIRRQFHDSAVISEHLFVSSCFFSFVCVIIRFVGNDKLTIIWYLEAKNE